MKREKLLAEGDFLTIITALFGFGTDYYEDTDAITLYKTLRVALNHIGCSKIVEKQIC